uniref:hypothetical protein n=2 Tax=Gelidibacter sp. TaxID=2018083 RepID=UPI00404A0EBA
MKTKLLTIAFFTIVNMLLGQVVKQDKYFDLCFDKDSIFVYDLLPKQKRIIEISITGKYLTNEVNKIKITKKFSDLSDKSIITVNFDQKEFSKLTMDNTDVKFNEKLYLTVEVDSLLKKDKTLIYNIIAVDSSDKEITTNIGERKEVVIVFKSEPKKTPLNNYKYLSYVGTNFDLVERIKTENLFFATNVFMEPTKYKKDFGIYLSLYGNRTISLTDDLGVQQIITEIVPVTEDSSYRLRKHVETTQTTTSDNLGAHFSTLHPIFGSRNKTGHVKTYFTISADFIWQRKHITTEYGEVSQVDTLSTASTGQYVILNDLQNKKTSANQYIFNIGLGLFFNIENESISMRVHMAAGYTSTFYNASEREEDLYDRKHDIFFAGRAWITEPKTGITLQAEIMNRLIEPRPYYVVTLSKAFNLDKLAGIFEPVTN